MNTAHKAIKGTIWLSISNYVSYAVTFVISILLARLLAPEDFGTVAMALVFVEFFKIPTSLALKIAYIEKQDEGEKLLPTIAFLIIIVSIVYLLWSWIGGLVLRKWYNQMIINIFWLYSLGYVFLLFSNTVFSATMEKKFDHHKISVAKAITNILPPLVSLGMAWSGYGIWSLVVGYLFMNTLNFILLWYFSRWHPKFGLNRADATALLSFGCKMVFSRGLEVAFHRLDKFVVGSFYGVAALGFYNRAYNLSELGARFVSPAVVTVSLPVYSRAKKKLKT